MEASCGGRVDIQELPLHEEAQLRASLSSFRDIPLK